MEFRSVAYETASFDALREFYLETFGLPVVADDADRFAVDVGETVVSFARAGREKRAEAEPFYHFTWDVPENRFDEAKAWLRDRTELLESPSGSDEVHFERLDFHSVYFRDPAGNLGEFAARHTTETASEAPFDETSFVRVSEVGLPVSDVTGVVERLRSDLGLTPHPAVEEANPVVTPVGNDSGMFPVMREWKPWFMTDDPARVHPITVELGGDRAERYAFEDYPYTLVWTGD